MNPEIYRQAGELFARLRELPDQQIVSELDIACNGNAELRAQVLRVIAADRRAERGFLEGRALEQAARLLRPQAAGLPPTGTVIGNYRLGRRIGAGGMGVVYEGQDLRLDRRVALKILPFVLAGEADERVLRFQREARAASSLNHPHIVSIFDADLAEGYHYIAMEFVEGQTLRQIICERKALDSQQILDWVGQAAAALSAAHEAGIVHRDIKPENIMIRPDGFVKVLDFGLAKLRDPGSKPHEVDLRTQPGNLPGTVHYLSPEQIEGAPASPRSDLFALGVVAYELATGLRPFDGPTDGAVFHAILTRRPPLPSEMRPAAGTELDNLVTRALEKDPELRFQTASDLRSSCRRLTRDYIARAIEQDRALATSASPVPSVAVALHFHPLSRLLWAAAGIVVILSVAFIWFTRPPRPPRVTRIVKLTSDTRSERFVTDGTRLYYASGNRSAAIQVFQVNVTGGDPVPMPRLTGMLPLDISADHSAILAGQILDASGNHGSAEGPYPIWVVDTVGNAARRLSEITAHDARWSPKGDEILYSKGGELRIASGNGSESRLVAAVSGSISDPAWSPDGRSMRFIVLAGNRKKLWQVAADGTHLHPVLSRWAGYDITGGAWMPDGRHFLFSGAKGDNVDLWAATQGGWLFGRGDRNLVRLTTGPIRATSPAVTPNGHRVLFLGTSEAGELVRYDPKSDKWVPYLGGLPGAEINFSPDGKSIVYVHLPDSSVWRSTVDGGARLQLTPPIYALNPRWSPDGKQIAFSGYLSEEQSQVFIVPASGGAVRQLTHGEGGAIQEGDISWSPDGASLLVAAKFGEESLDPRRRLALEMLDVRTGRIAKLPGSEGLWSSRLSPNGRYIAALGFPNRLWLYDVARQVANQLTTIGAGWPSWSADSRYVYFEDFSFSEWRRVRIADRKVERVANISGIKMTAASLGWCGLAPDGFLIGTRNTGGTAIYALDLETP